MDLDFPAFRPHPLLANGHLQTVVGCYWTGARGAYQASATQIVLPDGDALVVHDDRPAVGWSSGDPVVLLVHGLGGSYLSGYMHRCAAKMVARGWRVFRMDLRGHGAGMHLARQPGHAGRSEDVAAVLAHVAEQCPRSPIALAGFSMGANMVLKLAGELGPAAREALVSVTAVAPPIDLHACYDNMRRGVNRMYNQAFVAGLLNRLQQRVDETPHAFPRRPKCLKEFDQQFTAPRSGFASADDYYSQASSAPLLKEITVPTLIITADDDPIIPVRSFQEASFSPLVRLHVTSGGGHLGFIGRSGVDPDRRWADWRVIDWASRWFACAAAPSVAASSIGAAG